MKRSWIFLTVIVLGLILPQICKRAGMTLYQQRPHILQVDVVTANGVDRMPLEEYVVGVLLSEAPAEFELEALKAQAVAIRTYALYQSKNGIKHDLGDVCVMPQCCQGYLSKDAFLDGGGTISAVEKMEKAARETANQVATFQGELIQATYFSSSGGRTEDAQAVWGSSIPYLVATDSPGEEKATHYLHTQTFSQELFCALLDLPASKVTIGEATYTSGNGVKQIKICGKTFSGLLLRSRLGLKSTAFTVSVKGDTVVITTKGYGHRVGLSQYGADAMALSGCDYKQILKHYYQGAAIEQYLPHSN